MDHHYPSPRKIDCTAVISSPGVPTVVVCMPSGMGRLLVRWFLRESRNPHWKIVEVSSFQRKECQVPKTATVVSYPEHEEAAFNREFQDFYKRMEALRQPSSGSRTSAQGGIAVA